MTKKKYKALMMDLDGTTIPNRRDGLPSQRVIDAVKKATQVMHVGTATARPMFLLPQILETLQLSGPSVINSGSQIIHCPTGEVLWEQLLNKEDIIEIGKVTKKLALEVLFDDDTKYDFNTLENFPQKTGQLYFPQLSAEDATKVIFYLSQISTIAINKIPAWKLGTFDIIITHKDSTKEYGLLRVAKMLGIETHEIIGVGDGYNDLALFMSCGLKIAMGNAVPELKAVADYVAPSVSDDGVAHIIEKFVLQ